jgi:hypothetical protein
VTLNPLVESLIRRQVGLAATVMDFEEVDWPLRAAIHSSLEAMTSRSLSSACVLGGPPEMFVLDGASPTIAFSTSYVEYAGAYRSALSVQDGSVRSGQVCQLSLFVAAECGLRSGFVDFAVDCLCFAVGSGYESFDLPSLELVNAQYVGPRYICEWFWAMCHEAAHLLPTLDPGGRYEAEIRALLQRYIREINLTELGVSLSEEYVQSVLIEAVADLNGALATIRAMSNFYLENQRSVTANRLSNCMVEIQIGIWVLQTMQYVKRWGGICQGAEGASGTAFLGYIGTMARRDFVSAFLPSLLRTILDFDIFGKRIVEASRSFGIAMSTRWILELHKASDSVSKGFHQATESQTDFAAQQRLSVLKSVEAGDLEIRTRVSRLVGLAHSLKVDDPWLSKAAQAIESGQS